MNVDGIQELMLHRDNGDLSDVEYLDESRRVIGALPAKNAEEEGEKHALLTYIESLRVKALYWQNREIESLANEVEDWLCEPTIQ